MEGRVQIQVDATHSNAQVVYVLAWTKMLIVIRMLIAAMIYSVIKLSCGHTLQFVLSLKLHMSLAHRMKNAVSRIIAGMLVLKIELYPFQPRNVCLCTHKKMEQHLDGILPIYKRKHHICQLHMKIMKEMENIVNLDSLFLFYQIQH